MESETIVNEMDLLEDPTALDAASDKDSKSLLSLANLISEFSGKLEEELQGKWANLSQFVKIVPVRSFLSLPDPLCFVDWTYIL